jgi:hypothetical protein
MRNMFSKQNFFKLSLFSQLLFLTISCAASSPVARNQEPWQLFALVNKGQHQLFVNVIDASLLEPGVFKCSAKRIPSPERIKALGEAMRQGNKDAGLEAGQEDQFLKAIIDSESKYYGCEISCKLDTLYLQVEKQHIVEYPIAESGPDRDVRNSVCSGGVR